MQSRNLRREVLALCLAMRHPATPWYAKALAAVVVAYALSPLDLIPDPIPILGLLDDLVIVPAGLFAVRGLVPPTVLKECRELAGKGVHASRAWRLAGGAVVVALWLSCVGLVVWFAW
jgi:uncharacterized membrane protein YkvA (DUF1232 family)